MEVLELHPPFDEAWRNRDPFQAVTRLEGEIFREVKARRTLRFEMAGRPYFAKIHRGIGWREILKDLVQAKRPVLGAGAEFRAIRHLERLGVDTMTCVAFGQRGRHAATQRSFLITEALTGMPSLETFCAPWPESPPSPALKRALIRSLAEVCRRMHAGGLNHRDCYLCHFLLDPTRRIPTDPASVRLHVIDLHRAQIRRRVPARWRIKDLAGLCFSALDIGLTRTDWLRFVRVYEQAPLREVRRRHASRWQRVLRRARALYRKEFGRRPPTCP